jgi:hypothetical protein
MLVCINHLFEFHPPFYLPFEQNYILHGQTLAIVNHAKYSGVNITSGLNWNNHINHVVKYENKDQQGRAVFI